LKELLKKEGISLTLRFQSRYLHSSHQAITFGTDVLNEAKHIW